MNNFLKVLFAIIGVAIIVLLYIISTKLDTKNGRYVSHNKNGILDTTNGNVYYYEDGGYIKLSDGKETFVKKIGQ